MKERKRRLKPRNAPTSIAHRTRRTGHSPGSNRSYVRRISGLDDHACVLLTPGADSVEQGREWLPDLLGSGKVPDLTV